jgi:hypothetical protein
MKNKYLYYFLSFTWGLPMVLVGGIVALVMLITGHKPHKNGGGIRFEVGKNWGGVSLGLVILTNENPSQHIKNHEFGHTFQNCWWGPLDAFVIEIPSAIRYWYRELKYYRRGLRPPTEYDAIWFEGQATSLGTKYMSSWQ